MTSLYSFLGFAPLEINSYSSKKKKKKKLMLNYHRDIGPPRCALKVDIMKANDTIRWGCIMNILSSMGTPAHLMRCIKACITTPSFSISINGELVGFFASKRG